MRALIILFFVFSGLSSNAQEVNWRSFEELPQLMREEAKPVMVFLYTDWCKFCALQKNNTFTNTEITTLLNENYYCLKLDGESKAPIKFLNREYEYQATGVNTGQHELAQLLGKMNGEVSYPTTIILSENNQLQSRMNGFLDVPQLKEMILAQGR